MKIQFDSSQAYQLDAVASFVDLFEGQTLEQADFAIEKSSNAAEPQIALFQRDLGFGNALTLSDAAIYDNMVSIQERNDLDPITEAEFAKNGMNFSVEMETGTGKTYVYLRTIFALSQKYGFKKFIIVVPSVAIREGTLKNLEITADHFRDIYNNIEFEHFVYNSQKAARLRQFASSDKLQIMVINIDAFNKESNRFNQTLESLSGQSPKDFVQATNPIVIIDEPQSVDNTPKAKDAIASLNPLCIFRFSATHKNPYNLLYRLDPIKAYELRLVKQIVVASATGENAQNDAYIKLVEVEHKPRIRAKVRIQVQGKSGISEKDFWVKQNEDLYIKSNERAVYQHGFEVLEINADPDDAYIDLSSGRLRLGEERGGIKEDLSSIQIEKTIRKHLDKELQLRGKGIKVLSLFFIDKVANYRGYDSDGKPIKGKYAELFEEHYQKLIAMPQYKELAVYGVDEVHNGYFSSDKKGAFEDTNGSMQAEDDTYSVFQICTLNETKSVSKKRQEIGRGLRLPVNSQGVRVFDDSINKLTIVANESYDEFAATLQKEYEEDCGVTFGKLPKLAFKGLLKAVDGDQEIHLTRQESEAIHQELQKQGLIDDKGRITDKFKPSEAGFSLNLSEGFAELESDIIQHMKSFQIERHIQKDAPAKKLKLNKQIFLNEEFKNLWERIKHKTTYKVEYKTETLIAVCSQSISEMEKIEPVKVLYREILKSSGRLGEFAINPQRFMDEVVKCIQHELHRLMISGIVYEKLSVGETEWSMQRFQDDDLKEYFEDCIKVQKSVYETVAYDSDIELKFAQKLDERDDIKLFVKLPAWFKVETPIGTYNPDWAIVKHEDETLYLVRETKSSKERDKLRPSEKDKIACGEAHFKALEVDFKVVTDVLEV